MHEDTPFRTALPAPCRRCHVCRLFLLYAVRMSPAVFGKPGQSGRGG
uniref:Uncharacterized protein n=1 Tax=Faecalibaculum rodentium TaxID=1702221 RepID=A0A140DXS8_9FIRM|nr:hypothetical protein AALO17_23210 [Faecalibaculum rodentium]